jgi:DNA polymerase
MNIITLDFESYYSQTYSLTKLTTEAYVRGSEFEVIGVAVKVNDGETQWFSGTYENTKKFLKSFAFENNLALAHNAMFDAAILSWHFGINPRGWLDTLSMARAIHSTEVGGSLAKLTEFYGLGEKGTEVVRALGKRRIDFSPEDMALYGEYCKNDVELTWKLFNCMSGEFPNSELRLIDLTIKMFSEPVLELAPTMLHNHLGTLAYKKASLLGAVGMADRKELMSNDKFAAVLLKLGVEPPRKISPTTGKEVWAFSKTDEGFKALAEHEDVLVQLLVSARLGLKSTQEETRTQRFIDISKRGKLPIPLRYYAAHTGRWGGDDKINMQNLGRKSPLKYAICAPTGYTLIDADSSQIEARTVAWLAGQNDLVEAFENGQDVYKIMASAIYGKAESKITEKERFVGKTTILGAGYGMGATKFKTQLKTFGVSIEEDEAKRIIQVYRETYPRIPQLWKQASNALEAILSGQTCELGRDEVLVVDPERGIRMPNGLYIKYPNLRRQDKEGGGTEYVYDTKKGKAVIPNRIYGGKVVENCIAEGTEVFTDRGWVCIEQVRLTDKVHDGIEFVSHGGVVYKSVQTCINIDGVYMTPDHEVLTNDGWQTASQNPQPYRPDIRHAKGYEPRTQQREETKLAIPMQVRDAMHKSRCRYKQRSKAWRDTKSEKSVYDILDAGARSRFVVRGIGEPFIVHNCCQGLARTIIGEQMLHIAKKYKVVMTVHDSVVVVAPDHEVETAQEFIEMGMRIRPSWALSLPLNCEAKNGKSYGG